MWHVILAVDAVPCRIAFERGKERHFCFLAISHGTSGWILLLEQLPLKQERGIVRVMAPLAGSDVCVMMPWKICFIALFALLSSLYEVNHIL